MRPADRSRLGLSLKFQITAVLPELSVYDNLLLSMQAHESVWGLLARAASAQLHDEIMDWLERFRLADRADDLAGELSHGQQQWLEIAMSLTQKAEAPAAGRADRRHEPGRAPRDGRPADADQARTAHWSSSSTTSTSSRTSVTTSRCSIRAGCSTTAPCRADRALGQGAAGIHYPCLKARLILDVRNICAGYGRSQVLFDVTLCAPRSGGVAILGRNGAGKSTLLKTLIGEIRPIGGTIRFDGTDSPVSRTERRVRRGMGYVPQEQAMFGRLSVRENLLSAP